MYGSRPRLPSNRPIGYGQPIPAGDFDWRSRWPFVVSIIIGVILAVLAIVIIALEIASLAKGAESIYKTAATGAGIWCGFFFLVAAVFIIIIKFMLRTRLWATIAFIATIVAACFSIILIGLDAKSVQDGHDISDIFQAFFGTSYFPTKYRLLAAQLALACLVFLLCIAFIIMYIIVLIRAPKGRRQQQFGAYPSRRY